MGERIQKFNFLNLTIRGYIVLLLAKSRGYVCMQDVRRLYALSKRSKRAEKFLKNMVKNGLLYRSGEDEYVLTPKSQAAIALVQSMLAEAADPAKRRRVLQERRLHVKTSVQP